MKYAGIFMITLFLVGCGGDSSSSSGGGSDAKNVRWTLDPDKGPSCPNADDITRFNSDFAQSIDCIWVCANYKGQRRVYVDLGFERRNQPGVKWAFDTEYVSSGICY